MNQYTYNLRVTFPQTLASYIASENHIFSNSISLILQILVTLAYYIERTIFYRKLDFEIKVLAQCAFHTVLVLSGASHVLTSLISTLRSGYSIVFLYTELFIH